MSGGGVADWAMKIYIAHLRNGTKTLQELPESCRDCEAIVRVAIDTSEEGSAFQHASKRIRCESDGMCMYAVRKSGKNYEFLGVQQRMDTEIARIALHNYGPSLKYAPLCIKGDWELVRIAIASCEQSFQFMSKKFFGDIEKILFILENGARNILEHVSKDLSMESWKAIVLRFAELYSGHRSNVRILLNCLPQDLLADKDIALAMLRKGASWEYYMACDAKLQSDMDVARLALQGNAKLWDSLPQGRQTWRLEGIIFQSFWSYNDASYRVQVVVDHDDDNKAFVRVQRDA